MQCPADNAAEIDQSTFWDGSNFHWDQHRIGWAIAGASAAITTILTLISVFRHARNYNVPAEQRQIIRILYMPMIYAIISFFSYRYFRSYTFVSSPRLHLSARIPLLPPLARSSRPHLDLPTPKPTVYEAITLSAFLLLIIQFVAGTASGHDAKAALARKDKAPLPFPFCYWRYRPTKPYFLYTIKWSVLQYVIVRPIISIAGIIAQHYHVLCQSSWNYHFASVYLSAIDFVSISVALYGLILFYALTREELVGKKPLAKFLTIKLIVMATFYQEFVFSALQSHGAIKGTDYWTPTNIADGLNALATTMEMIIFAGFMMWAYPSGEYTDPNGRKTSIWRPLWDSINYSDFALEIWYSIKFYIDYARGKPHARSSKNDFDQAFGIKPKESVSMEGMRDNAGRGGGKDEEA
ncbi:hypothetical protein BOTBODRAFT_177792 [Botryobasidium botryosum FD-172 SS1]|uniref:DUF300-domain-containing protein n=1 Tax=Botryobasidium botryosum (strain FD-172 SS1) TaxID=930990 RepID=A0A067M570_BOTB1|nr:hypothetical protein BOTBODRAFT_177792 [Botryobasidium botryosum FD-172 SS1]